ncbi:MAG: hypothetical protein M5U27_03670 [Gaiella sp.]|nr:hypothetical protein [Gaiella sp.]
MRALSRLTASRRARVVTVAAGACLLVAAGTFLVVQRSGGDEAAQPAETEPPETVPPPAESEPPPQTTPPSPPAPEPTPPPPAQLPFSWAAAGAFVWHETDVEPTLLGQVMRDSGFGWVAVRLHDGLVEDPVEADWVYRFRLASGMPVGGWGVLRTDPETEAALAGELLARYGLDFYVANPEVEYTYSGPDGPSDDRSGRSQRFVQAFRALRPAPFPAGVSSYCRPDRHDIDWASWRGAAFAFLPQAYVNDVGPEAAPASCVDGAQGFFPAAAVHPTIGMTPGRLSSLDVATYAALLDEANTVGFSVYLAETRMADADWQALGAAIAERGLARLP